MLVDLIKTAVLQNIGPLKSAPKNWQKRNCPMCHTMGHGADKRLRFGIQFSGNSIAMHCFNCGFSATYNDGGPLTKKFISFLKEINVNDTFIQQLEFEAFKAKNNITELHEGETTGKLAQLAEMVTDKWKPHGMPKDTLSLAEWIQCGVDSPDFARVLAYAKLRGLTNYSEFYWCPLTRNQLNLRLIIPYYYKRNIVGYTARLVYDGGKEIPKYFQYCPTDFVYNLDNQGHYHREIVIVNEGVLDAWVTDGVGIIGEINKNKIDIINRLHKRIIVCPDRDLKGYDLVKTAIHEGWEVSFPKWSKEIKDAASASVKYGKLLTLHSIIDSAVTGKDKIQLQWDIEGFSKGSFRR